MNEKSMRKSIKVTAMARNDLLEIGRYTELKWGRSQRNHYLNQMDEAFNLSFQQGSHVIYYRDSEIVEIIRVLHERMDVERHIQKA